MRHQMASKSKSGSKEGTGGDSPSQLLDASIKELSDWRGKTLAQLPFVIKQADPEVGRGVEVGETHESRNTGEVARRNDLHR